MKKEVLVISIFLFLAVSLAQAQDLPQFDDSIKNVSDISQAGVKSNEFLEKEVQVPQGLQILARAIFGIKSDNQVNFQTLVILIVIWAISLFLIRAVLQLSPIGGEGITGFLIAIVVTLLVAVSGGLLILAHWILSLSSLFGALENYSLATLAIAIALLFGLLYLVSKVVTVMKSQIGKEKMRYAGQNVKLASEIGKMQRDNL